MQRRIILALSVLYPAVSHADTIVRTTTTVITTDGSAPVPVIVAPPAVDAPIVYETAQTGATLGIGVMSRALPASIRSGSSGPAFPADYTIDDASSKSLWLTLGIEKKNFVFMTDMTFGGASISGMTKALPDPPFQTTGSAPFSYTGTLLESSIAFRLGARASIGDLTLEAGSGIGGSLWIIASSDVDRGGASVFDAPQGPTGPTASWFIPVWADATYKVSHDWGLQVLASSDRAPGTGTGSTTLAMGMMFQPASP